MSRMQAEAEALHAEGIVGVQLAPTVTAGAATPRSSSRSAPPCGRCGPITASRPRSSSCR